MVKPRANNHDPKGIALQVEGDEAMREAARSHAQAVIAMLAEVAKSAKNDMARVSAGKELLDRGFGKNHLMVQQEAPPGTEIQVVFGEVPQPRARKARTIDVQAQLETAEPRAMQANGQEQP